MRILRIASLLAAVLLLMAAPAAAQVVQDLFDDDHSFAFAHYLEKENRFDLALEEYRRIDTRQPGNVKVRLSMLRLYGLANRPLEGILTYEKWNYSPPVAPAELRTKYVGLFFQAHDFQRLDNKIGVGIGLKEPEKTRIELHLALCQNDWEQARTLFERFEIQHVFRHQSTYTPIMQAVDLLPRRRPWLGGLLSVVPGAGQAYSGQWADAARNLFLVGVTGIEAYRLFAKRGPGNLLAWGLASASCTFYIANIYGGHRAARRFNERQDARIQKALDNVAVRDF